MKQYCVYIMTNCKNGTLYIGITNNLLRRVIEHKRKEIKGFTEKHGLTRLVWYDHTTDVKIAIQKEKQMKKWYRQYKINIINEFNPEWKDLFYEIGGNDEMLENDFRLY